MFNSSTVLSYEGICVHGWLFSGVNKTIYPGDRERERQRHTESVRDRDKETESHMTK